VWLAQPDSQAGLAAAVCWVQETCIAEPGENGTFSAAPEWPPLSLAQVLLAQDRADRALRLLDRLGEAALAGGRIGSLIEIRVLQAMALQAQGDTPRALETLGQSLTLAEPEGYVRVFVDRGQPRQTCGGQPHPGCGACQGIEFVVDVPAYFVATKSRFLWSAVAGSSL
jgi:LuxR family maltose regulon positive regulatory protein